MNMSTSKKTNQNNHFWQNHLSQWRNSGLSQTEYCRQHDLNSFIFKTCLSHANPRSSPYSPCRWAYYWAGDAYGVDWWVVF